MITQQDNLDQTETIVSFGLILRMPLERVPQLKRDMLNVPGVTLVYQKVYPGRLRIEIEEEL